MSEIYEGGFWLQIKMISLFPRVNKVKDSKGGTTTVRIVLRCGKIARKATIRERISSEIRTSRMFCCL